MKKITPEIVDQNVEFMVDGITKVIKEFGVRDPGSPGEKEAQAYFAKSLKNYADEVKTEEFSLHADAFMGWIYFDIAFIVLSLVAMWFNLNILSILFVVASIALLVLQLLFYKHVTAPFFPKKTSTNVYAAKKPIGDVKRRIIFCGHTDAAYEWGWLNLGGFPLFAGTLLCAVFAFVSIVVVSVIGMAHNGFKVGLIPDDWFRILLLVITALDIPFGFLFLHFSNRRKVVDGANDNLTACFEAVAVLKTMEEQNIRFEHTEVAALMAGSEEAGLRGAMAFAKAHKEEIEAVETIFIVLETLREVDHISIYSKDMNGLVKVDPDVCRLVQRAAKEAINRDIPLATVTLGSTDSAAFANAGMKSTCLAAMNHHLQPYYHTRKDTYTNLSEECLGLIYKVCMKTLEIYDKEGLPK